ncbi:MAG: hypothetical protein GX607_22065 [Myxococcales bacterium]|nr:hypothetical protein [Myxococcales bacterium]
MVQRCEVCASFEPGGLVVKPKLVAMHFPARTVLLCHRHARIAENARVMSFEGLQSLFRSGRRSFIPRRDPRSVAPPGEHRRGAGRRASDRLPTASGEE